MASNSSSSANVDVVEVEVVEMQSSQSSGSSENTSHMSRGFSVNFLSMDDAFPYRRPTVSPSTKTTTAYLKGNRQTIAKYNKHFKPKSKNRREDSEPVKCQVQTDVITDSKTEIPATHDCDSEVKVEKCATGLQIDKTATGQDDPCQSTSKILENDEAVVSFPGQTPASETEICQSSKEQKDTFQLLTEDTPMFSSQTSEKGIPDNFTTVTTVPENNFTALSVKREPKDNLFDDLETVLDTCLPVETVGTCDTTKHTTQQDAAKNSENCSQEKCEGMVNITPILEQFLTNIDTDDLLSDAEQILFTSADVGASRITKNTAEEIDIECIVPPIVRLKAKSKPVVTATSNGMSMTQAPSTVSRTSTVSEAESESESQDSLTPKWPEASHSYRKRNKHQYSALLSKMMRCEVRLKRLGSVVKVGGTCWKRKGIRWKALTKATSTKSPSSTVSAMKEKNVTDMLFRLKKTASSTADPTSNSCRSVTSTSLSFGLVTSPSATDTSRPDTYRGKAAPKKTMSAGNIPAASEAMEKVLIKPDPDALPRCRAAEAPRLEAVRGRVGSKRALSAGSASLESQETQKAAVKPDRDAEDKLERQGRSSLTDFERAIALDSEAGVKSKKAKIKVRRLSVQNPRDASAERVLEAKAAKSAELHVSQNAMASKHVQQSRLLQSILKKKKGGDVLPRIPKISQPPEAPRPFEEILKSPSVEPASRFGLVTNMANNNVQDHSLAQESQRHPATTSVTATETNTAEPLLSPPPPLPPLPPLAKMELAEEQTSVERNSTTERNENNEDQSPLEIWDFDSQYQFDTAEPVAEVCQSPIQTWEDGSQQPQGSDPVVLRPKAETEEEFISEQDTMLSTELASSDFPEHREESQEQGTAVVTSTSTKEVPHRDFENFSGFRESDRVDILSLCGDRDMINVDGFEADSSTNQTEFWSHQEGPGGRQEERLMSAHQLLRLPKQPWQHMMRKWNSEQEDVLSLCNSDSFLDDEEQDDISDSGEEETEEKDETAHSSSMADMLDSMSNDGGTPNSEEPADMPDSQAAEETACLLRGGKDEVPQVKAREAEGVVPATSSEAEVKVTDCKDADVGDPPAEVREVDPQQDGEEVPANCSHPEEQRPQPSSSSGGGSSRGKLSIVRAKIKLIKEKKEWKRKQMVKMSAKLRHCIKAHDVTKAGETVQYIIEQKLGMLDRTLLLPLMDMYIGAGALPQLFNIFFEVCNQELFNAEVCNAYIRFVSSSCINLNLVVIQKMLRRIFKTFSMKRIRPAGDCLLFLLNAFSIPWQSVKTLWQLMRYCNIVTGFSVPLPFVEVALKNFIERPVMKLRIHVDRWIQGAPAETLRSLNPTIINSPVLQSRLEMTSVAHVQKVLHGPDEVMEGLLQNVDEDVEPVRDMEREQFFLHRIQDCRRSWNLEYLAQIFVDLCRCPSGNRVFQRLYADILVQHEVTPNVRTFLQLIEEEFQRERLKDSRLQLDHVSLARVGGLVMECCHDQGGVETTVDLLHVLVDSPVVSRRHLVSEGAAGQKVLQACLQLEESKLALQIVENVNFTQDGLGSAVLLQQLIQQLMSIQNVKGAFRVLKILTERRFAGTKELAGLTEQMVWRGLGMGDIATVLDIIDLREKALPPKQYPLPDAVLRAVLTACAAARYHTKQQDLFSQLSKRGVYSLLPFAQPPYIIQLSTTFTPAETKMLLKERLKELYSKLCDDAANGRALTEMDVTVAIDIFFSNNVHTMSLPFLALGSRSKVLAVRALGKILELHMTPPLSARYDIRSGLVIIEPESFIGFLREMDAEGGKLGLGADEDSLEEKEPASCYPSPSSWKAGHAPSQHRKLQPKSFRHGRHSNSSSSRRASSHVSSSHQSLDRERRPTALRDSHSPKGKRRSSSHRDRHAQAPTDKSQAHFPSSTSVQSDRENSSPAGEWQRSFGRSPQSGFGDYSQTNVRQLCSSQHFRAGRERDPAPFLSQHCRDAVRRESFRAEGRSRSPLQGRQSRFSSVEGRDSNMIRPTCLAEPPVSVRRSHFPSDRERERDSELTRPFLHREPSEEQLLPKPAESQDGCRGLGQSQFTAPSALSESRLLKEGDRGRNSLQSYQSQPKETEKQPLFQWRSDKHSSLDNFHPQFPSNSMHEVERTSAPAQDFDRKGTGAGGYQPAFRPLSPVMLSTRHSTFPVHGRDVGKGRCQEVREFADPPRQDMSLPARMLPPPGQPLPTNRPQPRHQPARQMSAPDPPRPARHMSTLESLEPASHESPRPARQVSAPEPWKSGNQQPFSDGSHKPARRTLLPDPPFPRSGAAPEVVDAAESNETFRPSAKERFQPPTPPVLPSFRGMRPSSVGRPHQPPPPGFQRPHTGQSPVPRGQSPAPHGHSPEYHGHSQTSCGPHPAPHGHSTGQSPAPRGQSPAPRGHRPDPHRHYPVPRRHPVPPSPPVHPASSVRHSAPPLPQQASAPHPPGPPRGRPPRPWRGQLGPRSQAGFRGEHAHDQNSSQQDWEQGLNSSENNWEESKSELGWQSWEHKRLLSGARGRGQAFRGQRGRFQASFTASFRQRQGVRTDQEHNHGDWD